MWGWGLIQVPQAGAEDRGEHDKTRLGISAPGVLVLERQLQSTQHDSPESLTEKVSQKPNWGVKAIFFYSNSAPKGANGVLNTLMPTREIMAFFFFFFTEACGKPFLWSQASLYHTQAPAWASVVLVYCTSSFLHFSGFFIKIRLSRIHIIDQNWVTKWDEWPLLHKLINNK